MDYIFICLQYDVQAQEWKLMANDVYSDSSSTLLETSFFSGAVLVRGYLHYCQLLWTCIVGGNLFEIWLSDWFTTRYLLVMLL